jgi:hydroxymethylpyrimidine/phosphomethylpyrimidine kinase
MKTDAVSILIRELLPLATLVTPNIPEAEVLSEKRIVTKEDMLTVAKHIGDSFGCAVLLKGGHSINDANDLLYSNGQFKWFCGKRINNPNTHGTGCTLSSAIASNLAKGYDLETSIQRAKDYISGALAAMLDLGAESGPMNHAFDLCGKFAEKNRK